MNKTLEDWYNSIRPLSKEELNKCYTASIPMLLNSINTHEKEASLMSDPVSHPDHYATGKFETIDIIEDVVRCYPADVAFSIGNTIKYISRAPKKGKLLEDLKKARWYLNRAIDNIEQYTEGGGNE